MIKIADSLQKFVIFSQQIPFNAEFGTEPGQRTTSPWTTVWVESRCDKQNGHQEDARKLLIPLVPSTRFEVVAYRV